MGFGKAMKYAKYAQQAQEAYNKYANKPSGGGSSSSSGHQGYQQQGQASTSHSFGSYPGSRPSTSTTTSYTSGPPPTLNELNRWFDYYDTDMSGTLDREEVVNALVRTTGNFSPHAIQSLRDTVYGVWSTFDRDNSGGIDKREFLMPGGLGESLQAMYAGQKQQQSQYHMSSSKPSAPPMPSSVQPPQPEYQLMRAQIPSGMGPGQSLQVRSPYTGQVLSVNIPPQNKWIYPQAGGPPAFDFKVPMAPPPPVATATAVAVGGGGSSTAMQPHVNQQPWQSYDSFRGQSYQPPPLGLQHVQIPPYRNPIRASGRRRALLIGINYRGTRAALKGCINDATNMRNTLLRHGYPNDTSHMVLLTDENPNRNYQPTGQTILKAMQWLVQGASEGDVLFFHFSGHGAQVPDKTGHEADGMNETILPMDYKNRQLTDDELWGSLVYPLPNGVRLMAVMDCCHSGTGLDLPYDYKLHGSSGGGNIKIPKGFGAAGDALNQFMASATQQYAGGQWVEDVNPAHSQGDVVLFSGCEDSQTSADVQDRYNGAGGAMTQSFLKAYQEHPNSSYPEFLAAIHKSLKQRGFKQRPQLTASQRFDVSQRIFSFTDGIEPNGNSQIGRMKRRHVKPGKAGYGGGFDIDDLFKGGTAGKVAAVAVGAALLSELFD